MGVNCRVWLPPDVRVRDVATVIGAAAGLPMRRETIGGHEPFDVARVDGVTVKGLDDLPTCANIDLRGPMVDGESTHYVLFNFEPDEPMDGRIMLPRSTAFWIAVMRRVVDFFGGMLDYSDADASERDYSAHRQYGNNPTGGAAYHAHQERMLAITPVTPEELAEAQQHAAYCDIQSTYTT